MSAGAPDTSGITERGEARRSSSANGTSSFASTTRPHRFRSKSEYAWMHDVLRDCPGFEDDEDVWRLEVQLRGDILRELSCRSRRGRLHQPAGALRLRPPEVELRVPGKDTTITRWPADPRWVALRQVDGIAAPVTRSRRVPRMLSQKEAARRALSALTTLAAYEPPDLTITEAQVQARRRDHVIWSTNPTMTTLDSSRPSGADSR